MAIWQSSIDCPLYEAHVRDYEGPLERLGGWRDLWETSIFNCPAQQPVPGATTSVGTKKAQSTVRSHSQQKLLKSCLPAHACGVRITKAFAQLPEAAHHHPMKTRARRVPQRATHTVSTEHERDS